MKLLKYQTTVNRSLRILNLSVAVFIILGMCGICVAQTITSQSLGKSEKEIRNLIKNSRNRDLKISDDAKQKLSDLDLKSVPVLIKIVKKAKPCIQVVAAQITINLDRNNKELVPLLVGFARGGNLLSVFNFREEFMCRRGAAFLLAFTSDGIRELTKMLKNGDLWERQSAIFAFDELTETSDYPSDVVEVMKEAIPVIAESGKSKDEVMQDMSNEVLSQIVRHSPKILTDLAKKYYIED
jgi:hypothetical protein